MAGSAILGERLESYVDQLVRSGKYLSREEVLREGVRLIEARETRLATLDAALARGIADADSGRVKSLDEVSQRLIAKYEGKTDAQDR